MSWSRGAGEVGDGSSVGTGISVGEDGAVGLLLVLLLLSGGAILAKWV